jgi:GTP-binding protein EngB required for normal cell division
MTKVDKIYQEEKEKAIEDAKEEVRKKEKLELAKNLMDVLSVEMIAKKTGLSREEVENLRESK